MRAVLLLLATIAAAEAAPTPVPRPASPRSAAEPSPREPAPLPPPRPADLAPAAPQAAPAPQTPPPTPQVTPVPSPPATPQAATASDKDAQTCKILLESGAVVASPATPILGANGCGIAQPITLRAIVLPDKRQIRFAPQSVLRCDVAAALARWVSEDVAPTLAAQNLILEEVSSAEGYSCRGRNRVKGAKPSEHSYGNAVDIDAFTFAGGRRIALTSLDAKPFVALVRASACARFATVLGPGSDAYHDTHVHLDLAARRNNASLCQWNLPAGSP